MTHLSMHPLPKPPHTSQIFIYYMLISHPRVALTTQDTLPPKIYFKPTTVVISYKLIEKPHKNCLMQYSVMMHYPVMYGNGLSTRGNAPD